MAVSMERLLEIEEILRPILQEDLTRILVNLNRDDKLEDFCRLIGAEDVLASKRENLFQPSKSGYIVVLGDSQVKENQMQGILKKLGIRKDRLKCHLGYDDAKSFPFKTLQYQAKYSLILVGSMGHKAEGIGDYSSAIAMLEQEEGYPPVMRLGTNELKITKSNFQKAVEEALKNGLIRADMEVSV